MNPSNNADYRISSYGKNSRNDPLASNILKERYNNCTEIHKDETDRWCAIERVFSTRLRQTTNALGKEKLRFIHNTGYHTSAISSIINKTANQLVSKAIPIKERGVTLKAEGDILQYTDPDGSKARGLSDFSREIIEQFYSQKSGIFRELEAACKNLMMYGNAAISDSWVDGNYRATAMDFSRLIIETDEEDNSISAIFRQRAPSISKSIEYEVWLRNPRGNTQIIDLENKKSWPYLYLRTDSSWNILKQVPLLSMPIHYLRLYTIPGYPYGKGYGEELLSEGRNLHSFRAQFNHAAQLSLNPPIFVNILGVKDWDKIGDKFQPGQIIQSDMQAIKEMPLITPVTQYNINEIIAFAPYEDRLELAASKATLERYYGLPESPGMTAFEIAQRVDESTSVLQGPINSLNKECIIEIIENIKTYLVANDPYTFTARNLQDIDIKIQVQTRFDQEQNMLPASRAMQTLQMLAQTMQIKPDSIDNMDVDGLLREAALLSGCDPKFIVPPEVVAGIREQRAEQQQQQQQVQEMASIIQQQGQRQGAL